MSFWFGAFFGGLGGSLLGGRPSFFEEEDGPDSSDRILSCNALISLSFSEDTSRGLLVCCLSDWCSIVDVLLLFRRGMFSLLSLLETVFLVSCSIVRLPLRELTSMSRYDGFRLISFRSPSRWLDPPEYWGLS